MCQQEQQYEQRKQFQKSAPDLECRKQTQDPQGGAQWCDDPQRGVRPVCDSGAPILSVGTDSGARRARSATPAEARSQTLHAVGRVLAPRDRNLARGDCRVECRELAAKKGALVLTPYRHYAAAEKEDLLALVDRAQVLWPERPLRDILADLGLPRGTFYAWQQRAARGQLADRVVVPEAPRVPPTPDEVVRVVHYAEAHPLLGYKRLTWALVDENEAFLRPWMVYAILAEQDLLGRRSTTFQALHRPPEPDHADQRWHTDLMSVKINGRWFYLIDVLDAYSRYLVYWEILLTARANAVVTAGQRALETLERPRRPGEPEIVHDRGPQFVSHEWRVFVQGAQVTDIPTHAHHPQSNGRLERLHRTTREEGLTAAESDDLYRAEETLRRWQHYYNHERPHSALHFLRPIDYYRGDPVARLAEREEKLRRAAEQRAAYWQAKKVKC